MAKSQKFPDNLYDLNTQPRDRTVLQAYILDSTPKLATDLQAVLNSWNSFRESTAGPSYTRLSRHHHHQRSPSESRSDSVNSNLARGPAHAIDQAARLSTKPKKLPSPHKFASSKMASSKNKKNWPRFQFLSTNFRHKVRGPQYAWTKLPKVILRSHSRNTWKCLDYLCTTRIHFFDNSVLTFDDEFRGSALSERFSLSDQQGKNLWHGQTFSFREPQECYGKNRLAAFSKLRVHGISAVLKKRNGDYRPITDCGRPFESSLNSFVELDSFRLIR